MRGVLGIAVIALFVTPVWASTAQTDRVSVSANGEQGNYNSEEPAISGDGTVIAFVSYATNLVPNDTNERPDVFVRDREAGTLERVNVSSNEQEASGYPGTTDVDLSEDGRFVAFSSEAANLVVGDANQAQDVFVRDRETGVTERVSVSSLGTEGGRESFSPSISGDGRFVAFASRAPNLVESDTNGAMDVFVHDRATGVTERVSVTSREGQTKHGSYAPSISSAGNVVAFASKAPNLVRRDKDFHRDIFVRNREMGTTALVSVSSRGRTARGRGESSSPAISAEGKFVAFSSSADNLVSRDRNDHTDVFVHNLRTAKTWRVSVDSREREHRGLSVTPTLSSDGRFVAFRSYARLSANFDKSRERLFIRDRHQRTTTVISVSNGGEPVRVTGYGDGDSISHDARWVVWETWNPKVVEEDTNRSVDVFLRGPLR